jgi:hypothetical protein
MPYYSTGTRKAAQWYGELFAMTTKWNQLIIRYAQSLRSIGENDKAESDYGKV